MAPEIYFPNIGIKIKELNRVAFSLFGLDVYWYGIIIVSAIIIGYLCIERTLKKEGDKIDNYLTFIILEIILSVLGARAYYVIFSWDYYSQNLGDIFKFRNGGLGIYGGVLTAIITAIIYCKVTKRNLGKLVDLFIPYLALGQAMGRWGNFFNKEAFGKTTESFFAMALRMDSVSNIPQVNLAKTFTYFDTEYIQVHPTFLYESIFCLVIFLYLLYRYNYKHFDGEVLLSYMILYSFCRFFNEGLRTDQLLIFGVPISQIVAVTLFILGLALYIYKIRKIKKDKIENMKRKIC